MKKIVLAVLLFISFTAIAATTNSVNNTLGSFSVDTSGRATNASQPAFTAYYTGATTNVTGDNTIVTVPMNVEVRDQGNNFASNTFTAPVTGIYHFDGSVAYTGLTASNTSADSYIHFVTSTGTLDCATKFNANNVRDSGNSYVDHLSCEAYLAAGDTAVLQAQAWSGTKVVGVGGSDGRMTFLHGYLVG